MVTLLEREGGSHWVPGCGTEGQTEGTGEVSLETVDMVLSRVNRECGSEGCSKEREIVWLAWELLAELSLGSVLVRRTVLSRLCI